MMFALKCDAWRMYVVSTANGGVKFAADVSKAKTFKTHAAANAYRRKNERGCWWTVGAVAH